MPVETVEALWQPIATADDWSGLHATMGHIARMKAALNAQPTKGQADPAGNRADTDEL